MKKGQRVPQKIRKHLGGHKNNVYTIDSVETIYKVKVTRDASDYHEAYQAYTRMKANSNGFWILSVGLGRDCWVNVDTGEKEYL